jgi:hypothetical protein
MTEREALQYLASLIEDLPSVRNGRQDMTALKQFAAEIDVPFATVLYWHRVGRVPSWRLGVFEKRRINARRGTGVGAKAA